MHRRIFRLTGLMAGVTGFWLVAFWLASLTVPEPARAARTPTVAILSGSLVHIYAPPLKEWPIPIDRTTFDDYRQAVLTDDEGGLTGMVSRSGWIPVSDRRRVRVVTVNDNAVQVELVDGELAGERGWLLSRQLVP